MQDTSFIFTSAPVQLKNEGENVFVEGYITTEDMDLVNDIVTKDCILDMGEQMKSRVIKFDVEHEAFRGNNSLEKEINKTLIPIAKVDDFVIDKKGLKVRAMLNKNSQRYDEVKGSVENGFLDAFSIAYIPVKTKSETKNGVKVRMLDKVKLLNVAFTGNPVNTKAEMTKVFMKSLEGMAEEPVQIHESDQLNSQEVKNMSGEKEASEAKSLEAPVTPVVSNDKELSEMKGQMEEMRKELLEVKSQLNKPQYKAIAGNAKAEQEQTQAKAEQKSFSPLDLIA